MTAPAGVLSARPVLRLVVPAPARASVVAGRGLLRDVFGQVLRAERVGQGLTLRQASGRAHMSLGYLSEVERGRKEASSEVLAELAAGLGMSVGEVLRRAADLLDGP